MTNQNNTFDPEEARTFSPGVKRALALLITYCFFYGMFQIGPKPIKEIDEETREAYAMCTYQTDGDCDCILDGSCKLIEDTPIEDVPMPELVAIPVIIDDCGCLTLIPEGGGDSEHDCFDPHCEMDEIVLILFAEPIDEGPHCEHE